MVFHDSYALPSQPRSYSKLYSFLILYLRHSMTRNLFSFKNNRSLLISQVIAAAAK